MTQRRVTVLKEWARDLTPPLVWRRARRLKDRLRGGRAAEAWGLRGADWYDRAFTDDASYASHYTASSYYFVWTVLADRMARSGVARVLDLGCGPGQFAQLLADRGFTGYRGVDFSEVSIAMARQRCPGLEFTVADLTRSDLLEAVPYDCIVTLEFLEHVEFDLDIVRRIRPGTRFYATVPNFPFVSHVRHFTDAAAVRTRYGEAFRDFSVDALLENAAGKTFFLMEGVKR